MKTKELMQGDWITYKTECYEPYSIETAFAQITGFSKYGIVYAEVHDSGYCPPLFCEDAYEYTNRKYDKVEPIPLTEEILKKNGFKYFKSDTELHPYYYIEHEFSMKCAVNGDGHFYLNCIGADIRIRYVHELQRVLRCCGLWDIANNFKV